MELPENMAGYIMSLENGQRDNVPTIILRIPSNPMEVEETLIAASSPPLRKSTIDAPRPTVAAVKLPLLPTSLPRIAMGAA